MKLESLHNVDTVISEAQEFLSNQSGVFSMPLDSQRISDLRNEPNNVLFRHARKLRFQLIKIGLDIVHSGINAMLLPELSEIIRVLDLILDEKFYYKSLEKRYPGFINLPSIIKIRNSVSFLLNEVSGYDAEVAQASLANDVPDAFLRDGIPINIDYLRKQFTVLHLVGRLTGNPKKIDRAGLENQRHHWSFTNLPIDADLDGAHRIGRLWDGFEIATQIVDSRQKHSDVGTEESSITLIENTNNAHSFGNERLLCGGQESIKGSRSLVRDLLLGHANVLHGSFEG